SVAIEQPELRLIRDHRAKSQVAALLLRKISIALLCHGGTSRTHQGLDRLRERYVPQSWIALGYTYSETALRGLDDARPRDEACNPRASRVSEAEIGNVKRTSWLVVSAC